MNAIFVAQSHREDIMVHLVLESTQDFSRTISFSSNDISNLSGFHEQAWLEKIAHALDKSIGMNKEQLRNVEPGICVRTISFEKLVGELAEDYQLYMLDKKGDFYSRYRVGCQPMFFTD